MKRTFFLFCLLVVFIILVLSCQKRKEESVQKIKVADDFKIVENENKPQDPSLFLKFEEDLSITQEAWWPWEILVDEENIYVLTGKENLLKKFNPQGIEVSSKKFREGQGPGEFQHMDPCFSVDGFLFVADFSQRRLTIMNKAYEIQDIFKFDFWGQIFRLDSKGNMYFLVVKPLPGTTDRQNLVLTKYSPFRSVLYEISEYIWGVTYDQVKGKYLDVLFRPQLKYKIDSHDNTYYAMSDKYEINIVSPEGKLIKKIVKKGQSRKVTQKDIDKVMPSSSGTSRVRREYKIPEHMPCISDLFVLDNNYLLVVTFENDDDDPTLAGDLYDEKGIYRARVQVPKYYKWDFLLAPSKNYAIYKNNLFYTLETDEDEENFFVKRYKMIWE